MGKRLERFGEVRIVDETNGLLGMQSWLAQCIRVSHIDVRPPNICVKERIILKEWRILPCNVLTVRKTAEVGRKLKLY